MKSPAALLFRCLCFALAAAAAACSLAPHYQAPAIVAPAAYRETAGWAPAHPSDADGRGDWWTEFRDPELDRLEADAGRANQDIRAALARFEEARAAAAAAQAGLFPTVTGAGDATRQKSSRTVANSAPVSTYNDFEAGAGLSWDLDLWGRVRNTALAARDLSSASAADLAATTLGLRALLATDYFLLRGFDAQQTALDREVSADEKALALNRRRHAGGIAPEADVDQAETQLENAKTAAADLRLKRAQAEHAVAVLTGRAPGDFRLPAEKKGRKPQSPVFDAGLPSTLLERRPDIAAAERRVAAANADIGVARAAWFPAFSLAGAAGFESGGTSGWIAAPSSFWSLGPSAVLTIFDAGRIKALNARARAAYDEAAAGYRETVLTAFQQVEDNLAAQRQLAREEKTQAAATAAAERALKQARNRYAGGIATYLEVVVAENTALQAELAAITLETQRLVAGVQLVEALGGGWHREELARDPRLPRRKPRLAGL